MKDKKDLILKIVIGVIVVIVLFYLILFLTR